MKNRVISYLWDFTKGKSEDLSLEIRQEMSWESPVLKEKSKEVLTRILHQYSQFSISTIDAFFQRVIRSFTRESGLLGNFRLEAENDLVLHEVIAGDHVHGIGQGQRVRIVRGRSTVAGAVDANKPSRKGQP